MQIVTAAVMKKDGRILIAQRRRGDHQQYKWELPGGKLESHETPEECLRRELREEFGIETEIGEFVGSSDCHYRHTSIRLMAFRAYHISGELNILDHETIQWVLPSELVDFDFSEADKPIIQQLTEEKI
jgi:8-oxo-dGTP diphosphatase